MAYSILINIRLLLLYLTLIVPIFFIPSLIVYFNTGETYYMTISSAYYVGIILLDNIFSIYIKHNMKFKILANLSQYFEDFEITEISYRKRIIDFINEIYDSGHFISTEDLKSIVELIKTFEFYTKKFELNPNLLEPLLYKAKSMNHFKAYWIKRNSIKSLIYDLRSTIYLFSMYENSFTSDLEFKFYKFIHNIQMEYSIESNSIIKEHWLRKFFRRDIG